jgi:hypothetical protein
MSLAEIYGLGETQAHASEIAEVQTLALDLVPLSFARAVSHPRPLPSCALPRRPRAPMELRPTEGDRFLRCGPSTLRRTPSPVELLLGPLARKAG